MLKMFFTLLLTAIQGPRAGQPVALGKEQIESQGEVGLVEVNDYAEDRTKDRHVEPQEMPSLSQSWDRTADSIQGSF